MKNTVLIIILSFLVQSIAYSQVANNDSVIYKRKNTVSLIMKVIYPPSMDKTKKYPGMVFYSGGNWDYGNLGHFQRQADYFAKRGVVCFLAEYGIKNSKKTKLLECVADAKSSIRYIRENANLFNIDGNKIVAAGGSAGGYLAIAVALVEGYDDPNDNLKIDAKPNAMVLFNPIVDFGPGDPELFEMVGEKYKDISPLHNIKRGVPPAIILQGTADKYTPVETIKYYKHVTDAVGSRCDLILYEGQQHGFFNYGASKQYYQKTVLEVDKFLQSLGHIDGEPTIMNDD